MSCHVCPGLSDEDFLLVEEARAVFHGLSAAIQLSLDDSDYKLNLPHMATRLQEMNKKLADVLRNYGGYARVMELKGTK